MTFRPLYVYYKNIIKINSEYFFISNSMFLYVCENRFSSGIPEEFCKKKTSFYNLLKADWQKYVSDMENML